MNQAVISCLHANLPAVEAVLKDIELQGITNITCLGDLVGYGPQPNEVIELIKDKKITIYLPRNKLYLFDNNKNRLKT